VNERKARIWFGATAFVVFFGLVVQLFVVADLEAGFFDTRAERVLNVFAFFTIQSNIILGATCLLLALDPHRSSTVFRVLRLTGVVAIAITGVVYHSALADLVDLESWALVADHATHTIAPVMGVAGWLMFGPRGQTSARVVWLSAVFPVGWCIFTLIRGAIIDWYPYPFIDVGDLGYARVFVNGVWIAVLYLGVASAARVLDRWLVRVSQIADPERG
jgi:hypothetical protein